MLNHDINVQILIAIGWGILLNLGSFYKESMKLNEFKLFFLVITLCCGAMISMQGQNGTIRGTVLDAETGEPIVYGNILIQGTTLGSNTDLDGFFTIANVPAGEYLLVATYLGYDSTSVRISLGQGQIINERIFLSESAIDLGTVNVSARREEARNEVMVATVKVSPKQIKSLPSTGGEADIAQYLPVLPGVIVTGDQGGQLYIRGGAPIQNKILLDGMTIYNPFHSIGFFSVFETETIQSVEVLTGGFNAEHAGRVSAVVDIKTREGNKKRFGGMASLSPFMGKLLLEGPIVKLNEERGSSISYMVTGKHSFLDQSSKLIYPHVNDTLGLPYQFTDVYAKISFLAGNGSRLNLFGFNFDDQVQYPDIASLGWKSRGGGANFRLIPNSSNFIVDGLASVSDYNIDFLESNGNPRNSNISGFNMALEFSYFGENNKVNYGFDLNGFRTDFSFKNAFGYNFEYVDNNTELGGFVKYQQKWGNLILEPGFRVQYYASLNDVSLEPRFGMKYKITDYLRLKFAGGYYSQNLIGTLTARDVVNLFNGYLSSPPRRMFQVGTNDLVEHRLQKARHAILGLEIDVLPNLELNIEPYIKDFTQIVNINRKKDDFNDPDFVTEEGKATGIDLSVRYEIKQLYLWSTYSYGMVNYFNGEQTYPTVFDRRHNVNFLATYDFGSDLNWEFGARWNFGSGFLFTQTQGFYGFEDFTDGISTDYLSKNPDLKILFSDDINGGRLPYYHRLDLSLKRTIEFSKYANLEITASVTNVYNRNNIFYVDRITAERVDQLPILPSLSMKFNF